MDIAIIGMAGRFPEARNAEEFYQNLRAGRDSVRKPSLARLRETVVCPKTEYRVVGFLDHVDKFDYPFFDISKAEAQCMDPRQRLLLETAYETFENAGYNVDDFRGSDTALFMGDVHLDYDLQAERFDPMLMTGNRNGMAAGRIARFFDLRGKALLVDTTCSSGLVALHLAANELVLGESAFALVCGVNLDLVPVPARNPFELGINAADGKAKPFSAEADGTGNGEMVGCLLLRPLGDALREGNVIHAVLKGSAVNQDAAQAASLTAPSSKAQADVIRKAWRKAGVDPRTIAYVEAHGTGTRLGDPIEVQGMNLAFAGHTDANGFCAISSVKSNIGHTDSAAGLAGLFKVILSLKHRELFPSLHYRQPNPLIDFSRSAVYVNHTLTPWTVAGDAPRRAGVSSFGLMGTNCHAVLEEAPPPAEPPAVAPAYLVVVSGKTARALEKNLKQLHAFLRARTPLPMADVQFTLGAGRKHYPHRFAAVVRDHEALLEALAARDGALPALLPGAGKKPPQLVHIFSHGTGCDDAWPAQLCGRYPVFAEAYGQCLRLAAAHAPGDRVKTFAFQYSFYQLLQYLGAASPVLLGHGTGQVAVDVVRGHLSLAEGIAEVLAAAPPPAGQVETKCLALIGKMAGEQVVFAEMVPGGEIGQALLHLRHPDHPHRVVRLASEQADPVLGYLGELYRHNCDITLQPATLGWQGRRTELPTYPFEPLRCWLKEPVSADWQTDWFHAVEWMPDAGALPGGGVSGKNLLLVYAGQDPLVEALAGQLAALGNRCIRVTLGTAFEALSPEHFRLDAGRAEDYVRLAGQLRERDTRPDGILYLGAYRQPGPGGPEHLPADVCYGLYAPLFLAKAFADELGRREFYFACLTAHAEKVGGGDTRLVPAHAMTNALLKSLLADYPTLRVTAVDAAYGAGPAALLAERFTAEMAQPGTVRFVAYREGQRFVPTLVKLPPAELPATPYPPFRENGVYVVTGGASGIGWEAARMIAGQVRCCLVILGKTPLPPKDQWAARAGQDDHAGRRCRALLELERLGADVTYAAADVSRPGEVAPVFADIRQRYGRLDGLLHAAGVGLKRIPVTAISPGEVADTLAPKVAGTVVLAEASRDFNPDFFVFFSSLNALVPLRHTLDYAAANAFEDAYAVRLAMAGQKALAVNWPGWSGARRDTAVPAGGAPGESGLPAVTNEEGLLALVQAMQLTRSNVAVINTPLNGFKVNPFFRLPSPAESSGTAPAPAPGPEPRETACVPAAAAPAGALSTQAKIAAIWAEVLKADRIDPEDDFFEIGGHSLNGSQVLNRIEQAFGLEIEFDVMFDHATVNALARYIEERLQENAPAPLREIEPVAPGPHYEVSHAQQRLWILHHFRQVHAAYHIQGAYQFRGSLDAAAFGRAVESLLARHESLRTTFLSVDDAPRQRVHDHLPVEQVFTYADLAGMAGQESLLDGLVRDNGLPFDLAGGPLVRMKLVRLAGAEYAFLLTMHHIISDGWSLGILLHDLVAYYGAYARGGQPVLAPLTLQYKDFSAWQKAYLDTPQADPARGYWLTQLAGPLPVLDLPFGKPRPVVKTYNGHTLRFATRPGLAEGVKRVQQQTGTTLFMVLVAGVKALLYRYTEQEDLVVGLPVAGRNHPGLENQVGIFVNTLALRTRLDGRESFGTLLQGVKASLLRAYEHQDYPLDRLVEELDLPKDPARSPLFDVMVALHNAAAAVAPPADPGDFAVEDHSAGSGSSKFDLTFNFNETSEGILVFLEYNTDLFAEADAHRMLVHYEQLLEAAVADCRQPVRALDYLPAAEKAQLAGFNETAADYPDGATLTGLFAEQVRRAPEAVAVAGPAGEWTYRQLDERAAALAVRLRDDCGVQPEERVAVLCNRSGWMIAGLLAALKAGAAYLPLDPTYPKDRLQFILGDAGVRTVVVDPDQRTDENLAWLAGSFTLLVAGEPAVRTGFTPPPTGPGNPDHLAYVIYTSGSTGRPKGVMITHRAVVNRIDWMWRWYGFTRRDVILQKTPNVFDVSVWEIFMPLCYGARLVICPREVALDPLRLVGHVAGYGVTTLHFVPGMLSVFLEACSQAAVARMTSLRHVMASGEALPPETVHRYYQWFSVPLHNLYGPTEAAVDVSAYQTGPSDTLVPIGRPISNIELLVLDKYRQPVPVGVTGEIGIAGVGLARGYLNRPELSAERFVAHPFRPGARLYLTGDLGKWLPDGNLVYLGRRDDQVKIRGNRVEPGEVENAMLQHEAVQGAVVTVRPDLQGEKCLCGYYVSEAGLPPDALRNFLAERLPVFMLPAVLTPVPGFRFTTNGKIDRSALPAPEAPAAAPASYLAPGTPLEREIAAVFGEILGDTRVGLRESFFAMGMDSLKIIRAFNRLRPRFAEINEVTDLFKAPTVELLAGLVETRRAPALPELSSLQL